MDPTTLIAAVLSGISGSLLTLVVTERRRWSADRREVYARFLRACSEAYRVARIANEIGLRDAPVETVRRYAARFDEWLGPWRQALSEVRLVGSRGVVEAAHGLDAATFKSNLLLVPDNDPDDLVLTEDGRPLVASSDFEIINAQWTSARDAFETAARRELGIDGWFRRLRAGKRPVSNSS